MKSMSKIYIACMPPIDSETLYEFIKLAERKKKEPKTYLDELIKKELELDRVRYAPKKKLRISGLKNLIKGE
jgi:hypothetical protein